MLIIFGEEVTGDGENYMTRNFITCTPHQNTMKSRMMRWGGNVARMGDRGNIYQILFGKSKRKRSLGRLESR